MQTQINAVSPFSEKQINLPLLVTLEMRSQYCKFRVYWHKKMKAYVAQYQNRYKTELYVSDQEYLAILSHLANEFDVQILLFVVEIKAPLKGTS